MNSTMQPVFNQSQIPNGLNGPVTLNMTQNNLSAALSDCQGKPQPQFITNQVQNMGSQLASFDEQEQPNLQPMSNQSQNMRSSPAHPTSHEFSVSIGFCRTYPVWRAPYKKFDTDFVCSRKLRLRTPVILP
jgi:hypothetical protein